MSIFNDSSRVIFETNFELIAWPLHFFYERKQRIHINKTWLIIFVFVSKTDLNILELKLICHKFKKDFQIWIIFFYSCDHLSSSVTGCLKVKSLINNLHFTHHIVMLIMHILSIFTPSGHIFSLHSIMITIFLSKLANWVWNYFKLPKTLSNQHFLIK